MDTISNLVEVQSKTVYGRQVWQPINDMAAKLAGFRQQATLTDENLKAIKNMGFRVVEVAYSRDGRKSVLGDL